MEIPWGPERVLRNPRNRDNRDITTNRRKQMESTEIKERNIQKPVNGTNKYVRRGHITRLPLRKPHIGYKRIQNNAPSIHYFQLPSPLWQTEIQRAQLQTSPP